MSLQKPIQDESLRVERDVDASILLACEVRGLADAPAKLREMNMLEEDTLSVITLLEVGPDGQINLVRVGVTGPKKSQKVPANNLFVGAPDGAKLRTKIDYACFNFPPGRTVSEWVSSDNLEWSVMKSNNRNDGVYDQAEYKDINVSAWSCRLVVTPAEESHIANIYLTAVPRPIAELGSLPGVVTGEGSESYPVIQLAEIRAAMAGVLEHPRHDGLAFYPVVVNRGPPGALLAAPDSNCVRVAMRGTWSGNTEPNALLAKDWVEATKGPGEPDQTPIQAEFAWPPVQQQVDDEDDDSATEMESGGLDLNSANERRARLLAESIRLTHGLPSPSRVTGGGADKTSQAARPGAGTGRGSGGVRTRSPSPTPSVVLMNSTKRPRTDVFGRIPKKKTSEIILQKDWPKGYDASMIDELTPSDVISIRKLQMEEEGEEKELLPGSGNAKRDHKIPLVKYPAQEDNRRDKLHDASFLRQCLEHPQTWYGMVPTKREEIVRNIKLNIFGAENRVASTTIAAMHDRGRKGIKMKHFLYKNKDVEQKAVKTTSKLSKGTITSSLEYDYEEAENMEEMMRGLGSYMAVMWHLWPTDYSGIVMLNVGAEYGFFKQAGTNAVAAFDMFCNMIISANSDDPERYPLVAEEAEKVAVSVLQTYQCLPYKSAVSSLLVKNNNTAPLVQQGAMPLFPQQQYQAPPVKPNNGGVKVGKVPANWSKLRVGKESICGRYQNERCKDQKQNHCMQGQKKIAACVWNRGPTTVQAWKSSETVWRESHSRCLLKESLEH